MSYRNAKALDKVCSALRTQRPGITLGTIRDPGGGSSSDHNPWVKDARGVGVVRAVDIMGSGADYDRLAANLAAKLGKHPAMGHGAYVIHKQKIISADRLGEGWRGMEDRGSVTANHFDHIHLSITTNQGGYDYAGSWGALFSGSGTGAAVTPGNPAPTVSTPSNDNMPTSALAGHQNGAGGPSSASGGSGGSGGGQGDVRPAGLLSDAVGSVLDVDDVKKLVTLGAALTLGVALVGLGAARLVKPTVDPIKEDAQSAALTVATRGAVK